MTETALLQPLSFEIPLLQHTPLDGLVPVIRCLRSEETYAELENGIITDSLIASGERGAADARTVTITHASTSCVISMTTSPNYESLTVLDGEQLTIEIIHDKRTKQIKGMSSIPLSNDTQRQFAELVGRTGQIVADTMFAVPVSVSRSERENQIKARTAPSHYSRRQFMRDAALSFTGLWLGSKGIYFGPREAYTEKVDRGSANEGFEFPMQFDKPICHLEKLHEQFGLIDKNGRFTDAPDWYFKQLAPHIQLTSADPSRYKNIANAIAHPHAYNTSLEYNSDFQPDTIAVTPDLGVDVANSRGDVKIARSLIEPLKAFMDRAESEGIHIVLVEGHRDFETQEGMYKADPTGASKPGLSEHHSGFAVDLYVRDTAKGIVRDEAELLKLRAFANDYGFVFEYKKDIPHFFYLDAFYPGLTKMLTDRNINPNNYHTVTDVINGIHNQYIDLGEGTATYLTDADMMSDWDFWHSSIFIDFVHANKSRFINLMEATRRLNHMVIPSGKTVDISGIVLGDLSNYAYGYVVGGGVLPAGGVCGLASAMGGGCGNCRDRLVFRASSPSLHA